MRRKASLEVFADLLWSTALTKGRSGPDESFAEWSSRDAGSHIHNLPWPVVRLCEAKVSSLQRRTNDLGKRNMALDIEGVGILVATSLITMKMLHKAAKASDTI